MPDRKEPHLVLGDDEKSTPRLESKQSEPPRTAETEPQSKSVPPLNRAASDAARAEVRRRLAEKNAAKEAESTEPSSLNQASSVSGGGLGGGNGQGSGGSDGASRPGFPWLAAIALVLAAAGLAFGGWQYQRAETQQDTLESLGNRIQELEIRLSETGQDLSEAGSTFSEKLEWADSEIRKLWVVAHQRNRPAIESLEEKLTSLQSQVAGTSRIADEAKQKGDQLSSRLNQQASELEQQLSQLSREVKSYSSRLAEVSLTTSTLSQQVRDQDRRQQVSALREDLQGLAEKQSAQVPENLDERLAEYDEILTSLETSRSQLTSRVTRLMDDVRELQQGR